MATSKEYLEFIMEQLPAEAHARPMMGEYLLYFRDRLFGGIYDGRLLVKPLPAARALLPTAREEEPYPGAKPMLMVPDPEDRDLLARLLEEMWPGLPAAKKKK